MKIYFTLRRVAYLLVIVSLASGNLTLNPYNVTMDIEDTVLNVRQDREARALSEIVAFYAHLSAPGCLHEGETVVFDTEVTDVSGSYNKHDGILDIPATGTYVLTLTVIASEYHWISLEIISNGKSLGAAVADSEDLPSHHSGSITIVVNLQLGDHVFVRKKGSNGSCAIDSSSTGFTSFAGWLLG